MKNVIITFAADSWEAVERLIHDALDLERGTPGGTGLAVQVTRIEVEK